MAALGCSAPRGPDGGGAGAPPEVLPPDPTPRQQPPPQDAGAAQDASGDADAADSAPLPPNFIRCDVVITSKVMPDPLAVWAAERDAHGALGRDATLELRGASYRVEGDGVADVRAPFTLRTGDIGSGIVSFGDARVDDIEERGKLELFAGGLSSSIPNEADATSGAIEGLPLATIAVEGGTLDSAIGLVSERIGNTDRYHVNAAVSELTLDGIYQAFLQPEGTSGGDARIEWMPTGPVLVHEASSLTFYEEGVGSVVKPAGEALDVEYTSFGLAGDFTGGTLAIEGEPVRGTPVAVFGRAGMLRADASSVASVDGVRVTQAINEAGLVVPAAVEIVAESSEVWVRPSESRVVRLHYRERSYVGDAVLGAIEIEGAAGDLLELQTRFLPDTVTEDLIDAVIDTGWAAPLAAITAIPAVSIVFVFDVFSCIFGGCLDQPPPLAPFPQWIDAGAIGTMEVRVKGDLPVGTYYTSLTFTGRNYCAIKVPLIVHIGDEPPPDADGGD
jgi:hypothetical protein